METLSLRVVMVRMVVVVVMVVRDVPVSCLLAG